MTTKYNELAKKYEGQISLIKRLKSNADALLEKVDNHDARAVDLSSDDAVYDHEAVGRGLYLEWQAASNKYKIEYERLSQNIDAEYIDVPFSEPRLRGIAKFWESAGL